MDPRSVRTAMRTERFSHPDGPGKKFQNYFPDKKNLTRPDGPGSRPDARVSNSVFESILGFQSI